MQVWNSQFPIRVLLNEVSLDGSLFLIAGLLALIDFRLQEFSTGNAPIQTFASAPELNHDQGPLSMACYELVTQQALGSPPWLTVRATAWSDLIRPHFTHTKRSMFDVIT